MTAGVSKEASASSWGPYGVPPWQGAVHLVITFLQRLGFVVGAMHVLAVPARRTGILRSTPVSLLMIEGERYIVAGTDVEWVLDARAAEHGMLRRGRVDEHVALIELPIAERVPILRALPRLAPDTVAAFRRLHGVAADPEALAGLAVRCPVFRVERG